jgi:phosphate transport system permease protein
MTDLWVTQESERAPQVLAFPQSPLTEDAPRPHRRFSPSQRVEFVVAGTAGVSGSLLLAILMDWREPLTLVIWAMLLFLVAEWLLVRDRAGAMLATDQVVSVTVWATAVIAVGLLMWMIVYVILKGIGGLSWSFFTQDLSEVGPLDPGGGAFHAMVGTLMQTSIAAAVAVPLAVLTAVYLHELRGRMAGTVRFVSDAMSGLPSIVAGLFIYTLWVHVHGFSGIAGAAALMIVMLPIVTRTAEEILRTVDPGLRESALAMGSPEWRMVLRIVLPTVRAGMLTAAILGIARAVGETAPVLITSFGSNTTNYNVFSGPQASLPLYIYQLIRQPNAVQQQRAWSGALLLIALVLFLFTLARVISNRGAKRLGAKR